MSGINLFTKEEKENQEKILRQLNEMLRVTEAVKRFDFSPLTQVLEKEGFSKEMTKSIIIELCRWFLMKVVLLKLEPTQLPPSGLVDQGLRWFLLLPLLYQEFCGQILPSTVKKRLINYHPHLVVDEHALKATSRAYETIFGSTPSPSLWKGQKEVLDVKEKERVRKRKFADSFTDDSDDSTLTDDSDDDKALPQFQFPPMWAHLGLKRPSVAPSPTAAVVPILSTINVSAMICNRTQTWTIEVDVSTTTVGQLKEQLCVQEDLPFDRKLIFLQQLSGKPLVEGRLLSHYNIKGGSIVRLTTVSGCIGG